MPTQTIVLRISQVGAAQTAGQLARIGTAARGAGSSLDFLRRNLLGLTGAGFGVRELLRAADGFTQLGNRTRVFATDANDAKASLEGIVNVAFEARAPLDAVAEVFQRFSLVGRAAGKSTSELLRVTETLAKSVAVSGASAQEAEGALRQLAQGYGANRLSGQEFNSVAEQLPIIARLIAGELGIATDRLRSFANEGKITREVIDRALGGGAAVIDQLFTRTSVTFSQAFTNLGTALTVFIGKFNEASGAGNLLTGALQGISRTLIAVARDSGSLNAIIRVTEGIFITLAVSAIPRATAALAGFLNVLRSLTTLRGALALLGGPFGLIAKGAAVALGTLFAFRDTLIEVGGTQTTIRDLAAEIGSRLVAAISKAATFISDLASAFLLMAGGPRKAIKAVIDIVFILIRTIGLAKRVLENFVEGAVSAVGAVPDALSSLATGDFAGAGAAISNAFKGGFDADGIVTEFNRIVAEGADPAISFISDGLANLGGSDLVAAAGERTKARLAEQERLRALAADLGANPLGSAAASGDAAAKGLSKEQKALVDEIRSLRGELDPAAALLNEYEDRLKSLDNALKAGVITQQEYTALLAKVSSDFNTKAAELPTEPENVRELRDAIQELRGELDPGVEALNAYRERLTLVNDAIKAGALTAQEAVPILEQVTQAYTDALAELNAQSATGFAALGEGFKLAITDLGESLGTETDIIAQGFTDAFGAAGSALKEFVTTGKTDIRALASEIISAASAAVGKLLLLRALQGIGGALGGASGGGGFLGQLGGLLSGFGGARATGGPVSPGRSFLVGERGPELFTPPETGRVVPTDALGGMAQPTVNVQVVNVDDPSSVPKAMSTKAGEQVVLNTIQRNASRLREILA